MEYSSELKEYCRTISVSKLSVTKDPKLLSFKEMLLECTRFLDMYDKVPLALRYHSVLHDIFCIPTCKICISPVTYKRDYPSKGFATYCSAKCSRSDKIIDKSIVKLLQDKDWLYNQRIILKKSKELIATELGISVVPITKWIMIHGIPEVKYNESCSIAKLRLEDCIWMETEHIINHRTCEDIGNELNVSKSTVSLYLSKHGIIANKCNSYDNVKSVTSAECQEIIDFIQTFYNKRIIINNRTIIDGLELDIYLPDDNLAIEYNGIYSHLFRPGETIFSRRKDAAYHIEKTSRCEVLGIQLIHIISTQWLSNKELWKSYIKNKLGHTSTKIYARNCHIREVSIYDKNIFLDANHIQGSCKSSYRYGLYYGEILVSLMTFMKSRYNSNYTWELVRFCTLTNTVVIGGFSKLLKCFRSNHTGSIISYANRNYSNGSVYENNGFILHHINKPSYWYVKDLRLIHKSNITKSKLLQIMNKPEWTEEILAEELGYHKLFDTGTKAYVIDK